MNPHSFSLSSIGMAKGRAQVKLDGEDISDVISGVGLDFSAREHPRVMLELTGVSADVAVDAAEIQLPESVVRLLGRLGWVSPGIATEMRQDLNDHRQTLEALRVAEVKRVSELRPVPNSDETSGEVSPDAVGRVIT
jgi:hypothetical protein